MQDSLILLAHHDDEFFLAPLIRDDCAAGAAVHVCYLTHGSVYGADAAQRAAESRVVLDRLGVAGEHIADLGLEQGIFDGELAEKAGQALGAVAARYAGRRFGRVYLMAWEGGHHDHDAAHMIALAYADRDQPRTRLREFPLYNSLGAPPNECYAMTLIPRAGCTTLQRPLTPREAQGYAELIDAYPSQAQVFRSLRPAIDWALHTRRSYHYRELGPRPDHRLRPHPGPLFYEQKFPLSFETFWTRIQSLG